MESPRLLIEQVAKEHGVSTNSAKRALYLEGLSSQNRTVKYAADALRISPSTVKMIARRFMIDLADYRPYARLEKKGLERPGPRKQDVNQPIAGTPLFGAQP